MCTLPLDLINNFKIKNVNSECFFNDSYRDYFYLLISTLCQHGCYNYENILHESGIKSRTQVSNEWLRHLIKDLLMLTLSTQQINEYFIV